MLPKPLGKYFYSTKKYPYPLKLDRLHGQELESTINELFNSTYFHMRNGPNYTLKVARTSMSSKEIYQNVIQAVNYTLAHIMVGEKIKHSRVQCISLKIGDSIDLPIFSQLMNTELASYVLLRDTIKSDDEQADSDNEKQSEHSDSD